MVDGNKVNIVPTVLYYEFILLNNGNKTIGKVDSNISVSLEPKDDLVRYLGEIYKKGFFEDNAVAKGHSFTAILIPGEQGKYTLDFGLGVTDKIAIEQGMTPLPDQDTLNQIKDKALHADLVVFQGGNEIARFHLGDNRDK